MKIFEIISNTKRHQIANKNILELATQELQSSVYCNPGKKNNLKCKTSSIYVQIINFKNNF